MQVVCDAPLLDVSLRDARRPFHLKVRDLRLHRGETLCIHGPSGSGKTLLLECFALLRAPGPETQFSLAVDGAPVDVARLWASGQLQTTRASLLGVIPQQSFLLPFLSARDNICMVQDMTARPDRGLVDDLLGVLDIHDVAHLRPEKLSIGQRQRVAIARAVAHRPGLIVADEPTAALDRPMAQHVMQLLLDVCQRTEAALLLSSHDEDLVSAVGIPVRRLQTARDADGATLSTLAPAGAEI